MRYAHLAHGYGRGDRRARDADARSSRDAAELTADLAPGSSEARAAPRTKARCPGDPQVDKIIRETIKAWRFKPFVLGSKKVKTCTQRVFQLRFK